MNLRRETMLTALLLAFFIASLYSAVLVVLKEENRAIFNFLKNTFGHHWIGHGITTLIIFAIFVYIFRATGLTLTEEKLILTLWLAILINLVIIGGFMLQHYFAG